jgi:periplasmic protein TonB
MSYLINNQQNLTDVIFATRNKQYGAYVLRSAYGSTVLKSLLYMLLGFGSFILTAYYLSNKSDGLKQSLINEQITPDDKIYDVPIDLTPKKNEPQTLTRKSPPAFTPPDENNSRISIIDSVTYEPAQTNTSTSSSTNVNTATMGGLDGVSNGALENGIATNTREGTLGDTPLDPTTWDSEPEFEGGLKALYKFVSSQLRYPEPAFEGGKEGTVYVKFIVDETGKVIQLTLLNHQGFGLDEEALRVVGMIPKFKSPAKFNGRSVKAYYQLPIKFSQR